MREKTSEKLAKIYDFIVDFSRENGFPPTVREIGKQFDVPSTATVNYYLEMLRNSGKITRSNNKKRSICLTESPLHAASVAAPLVGSVSAGQGIFAVEDIEQYVALPKDIFGGNDLFMLRVVGDSMINAGIFDGDLVIVSKQSTADVGEIVLAFWEENAMIKRLACKNPFILHPENDALEDIVVSAESQPQILGKVVGCIKKF